MFGFLKKKPEPPAKPNLAEQLADYQGLVRSFEAKLKLAENEVAREEAAYSALLKEASAETSERLKASKIQRLTLQKKKLDAAQGKMNNITVNLADAQKMVSTLENALISETGNVNTGVTRQAIGEAIGAVADAQGTRVLDGDSVAAAGDSLNMGLETDSAADAVLADLAKLEAAKAAPAAPAAPAPAPVQAAPAPAQAASAGPF